MEFLDRFSKTYFDCILFKDVNEGVSEQNNSWYYKALPAPGTIGSALHS